MKKFIMSFFSVALLFSIQLIFSTSAYCQNPHEFVLTWGSYGTGDGQFKGPVGVATDSENNVYVLEYDSHQIQKFDSIGNFITKWGGLGNGDGQFAYPQGIATDTENNVYVSDYDGQRIQKFGSIGNFITKWGTKGTGDGQFMFPRGIAVDFEGNVYVVDQGNDRIQKFDSIGNFITKWGSCGSGDGQFDSPSGVGVDSSGYVYVSEIENNRIQKFDSNGEFLGWWGQDNTGFTGWHDPDTGTYGWMGSGDGQFASPWGVIIDSNNNVYVGDINNDRIQKFDSNGEFLGWWGQDNTGFTGWHDPDTGTWGVSGTGNGQFDYPIGIAVDSDDYIYVVEYFNHRVQKFAPAYQTVTIDIKPGSYPNSINLGSNGNVPVAIFSTEDFDATTVDPLTVTLAEAEVKIKGKGTPMYSFDDVNSDGLLDIIVHVDTQGLELTYGDTTAELNAVTYDGQKIRGTDTVRIVQ